MNRRKKILVMEITVDRKLQQLKTQKIASKTRRNTKAKNILNELVNNQVEALMRTRIHFPIKRVVSEFDIIENIIKEK